MECTGHVRQDVVKVVGEIPPLPVVAPHEGIDGAAVLISAPLRAGQEFQYVARRQCHPLDIWPRID